MVGYGLAYGSWAQTTQGENGMLLYINSLGYRSKESANTVTLNKIYSLSGSYDGSIITFYENNVKTMKTNMSGGIKMPTNNTILALGTNPSGASSDGGSWFLGNMYSVRLYNRALTNVEVEQNYNVDKKRFNIVD